MDYRLNTFLILCETMNYRITAEKLHLTQPAVTKQIQSLEQTYGTKLFIYDGKKLKKTESCHILEKYAVSLKYNYDELIRALKRQKHRTLKIGATKTIGEYVIGGMISKYLSVPENNITLEVDNTHNLLSMLHSNKLDFAIVEGIFDKNEYGFQLLRHEPFIGICEKNSPLNGMEADLKTLFSYPLIVRERGSGTRNILERELDEAGYSLNSFTRVTEISSFHIISELVSSGCGISFVYNAVYENNKNLGKFKVKGFGHEHEFNLVYLKNTSAHLLAEEFIKTKGGN